MKKYYLFTIAIFILLFNINTFAADYYWVGNSGNWSEFGTHWATSSGGSTFHTQSPTMNDNVFFDANSFSSASQTVTIDVMAVCETMDWTGVTNSPDLTGWNNISIYGSIVLDSGMTASFSGQFEFLSDTLGNTLDFSTVSLSLMGIRFDGDGYWTFMSDFDLFAMGGNIELSKGTFNTNGYTISVGGIDSWTSENRTMIFGSSTINTSFGGFNLMNPSTLTIDAGTSTINMENSFFDGLGFTYYDVNFNLTWTSEIQINNSNTFHTLGLDNAFVTGVSFEEGKVNTIYDMNLGATCSNRKNVKSSVPGQTTTIRKLTGTVNEDYLNIQDITIDGGATFTTNYGIDMGNVTGWTINTPSSSNYYWVGGTGDWSDADHWSTTSGGAYPSGGTCVPTSVDNVVFDANSFTGAGQNCNVDVYAFCDNMTWTGVTNNPSFNGGWGGQLNIYGSLTFDANMTCNLNTSIYFISSNTGNTITSAGLTLHTLIFTGSGEWTLQDDLNCNTVLINKGSFITGNHNITGSSFKSNTTDIRSVDLGSSTITMSSQWNMDSTNLSFSSGTSTVSYSGYSFYGGNLIYNDVELTNSSTTVYGSNTFNTLALNGVNQLKLEENKTQIFNDFTATGDCGNLIKINSRTSGATSTFSKSSGAISISYVTIQDIAAIGGATFNANNSIDMGNTTGWTFGALASTDYYWINGSGNWTDASHWSLSSGGVANPSGCLPTSVDNVFFDANSGLNSQSVTVNANAYCHNMDWTGANNADLLGNNALYVYGSLNLIANMDIWFSGSISFKAQNTGNVINTAGKTFRCNVYFDGDGEWTLLSNFTTLVSSNKSIYFEKGSLITNDFDITTYYFQSNSSNTRQLSLGNTTVDAKGWSIIDGTNMTITPATSTINIDGASYIRCGGLVYNDFNVTTTSNIRILGSNTFNTLNIPSALSIKFEGGTTQIFSTLTIPSGTDCNDYFDIGTTNTGVIANLSKSSGTFTGDWLRITDLTAGGGATFNATNSIGVGTTTGWNITSSASVDLYWIGNSGNWNDANNWSLTSGGAVYGCIPTSNDNVFFDANSFSAPSQALNIYSTAYCKNMDWTGVTNNPDFQGSSQLNINGSLTLVPTMTLSYGGTINFTSALAGNTITTAGFDIYGIKFSGSGDYSLNDSLTLKLGGLTFNNGTLNTNGYNIYCTTGDFQSNSTSVRTLNLGATTFKVQNWKILDATNMTLNAGISEIITTNNSSDFIGGDLTYNDLTIVPISFNSINIIGSNTFNNFSIEAGTEVVFNAGDTQTTTNLIANGSSGSYINMQTSTSGSQAFINQTGQGFCGNWLKIKDISVGTQAFYAGENSIDLSGNAGWTWSGVVANNQYPAGMCEEVSGSGTVSGENLTSLESAIDGGNGSTHNWYTDAGLTTTVSNPANVTVSNGQIFYDNVDNGTCTNTAEVIYTVYSKPTISETHTDITTCGGSDGAIDITSNATGFSWTGPSSYIAGTDDISGLSLGTYYLTASNANCSDTTSVIINESGSITISVSADTAICGGSTITLTASGATSYTWSPSTGLSSTTGSVVTAMLTSPITYVVTGTTSTCTSVDSINISILPFTSITTQPTGNTICENDSITFDLSANGANLTYQWQKGGTNITGATDSAYTINGASPSDAGVYTCDISGTCGNATSNNATLVVDSLPTAPDSVNVLNPSLCLGGYTHLVYYGGSGTTFRWYKDSCGGAIVGSGNTYTIVPTTTTTYYGRWESSCGNSACLSVTVTVDSIPVLTMSSTNASCGNNDGTATVVATGGATPYGYLWSDASSQTTPTATNLAQGIYYVTVSAGACTATGNVTVNNNGAPTIYMAVSDTIICEGDTITLQATGTANTYTWSPNTNLSDTVGTFIYAYPTTNTTYVLTGTSSAGCSTSMSVNITVNHLPTANFTVDSSNEPNISFTNTTSGTNTYSWDFGDGANDTTTNATHLYTANGTYTIVLSATNSCGTDTAQHTVSITSISIESLTDDNSLKIYPNPNNGNFNVEINKYSNTTIEVINLYGQTIFKTKVSSNITPININDVSKGVYLIKIQGDSINSTKQFIVR